MKNKKINFKKIGIVLLRFVVFTIVGIVYELYLMIRAINKKVAKMFNSLRPSLKTLLIYALILGNIPNAFKTFKSVEGLEIGDTYIYNYITNVVEQEPTTENAEMPVEETKDATEETKTDVPACQLSVIECKIYNKALEVGLNESQAYVLLAISKHETGSWTSTLFVKHNNFGGLYNGAKGQFYSYSTQEEGLNAFVNLLKNRYYGQGLDTIQKIGSVYCPVGAGNDPQGLNQYWVPKVTQFYNAYTSGK